MAMKQTKLNVEVKYTAFHEDSGKVLVKQIHKGGKQHFRVRLYLDGPDLDKVEQVVYTLHPTFKEPRREVNQAPDFALVIWTWGIFDVEVEIYDHDGAVDTRTVHLDYSPDINQAQAKNLLFWAS